MDSYLTGYSSSSYLSLTPAPKQCPAPTTQSAAFKPPAPPPPAGPPVNVIQMLRVECSDATRFNQASRGGVPGSAKLQIVATEGALVCKVAIGTSGAEVAAGSFSAKLSADDKAVSGGYAGYGGSVGAKGASLTTPSVTVGTRKPGEEAWKQPEEPEKPKTAEELKKEEEERKAVVSGAMLTGTLHDGGTDTLTFKLYSTMPGGRKQVCVRRQPGPPAEGDWTHVPPIFAGTMSQTTHKITAPAKVSAWPLRPAPDTYYVWGRAEGAEALCVVVESFPSTYVEVQLDITLFGNMLDAIKKAINKLLEQSMEKLTSAIRVETVFEGPKGSLGIKGGWKETKGSNRVGYPLEATAALAPMYKVGLKTSVSLIAAAEEGLLACVGIVAPVSTMISDMTKYCADVRFALEISETISQSWSGKVTFDSDGKKDGSLSSGTTTEGSIKLALEASIGNDCILGASIEGAVETGLRCEGKSEITSAGLSWALKVIWPAITLTLTVKFRAGVIHEGPNLAPWKPFDERVLFEAGPYQFVKF